MNKIATIIGLMALAPLLGGCFSYTHETAPPSTTTVVQPGSSTTATTTTTTTTPPPNP